MSESVSPGMFSTPVPTSTLAQSRPSIPEPGRLASDAVISGACDEKSEPACNAETSICARSPPLPASPICCR